MLGFRRNKKEDSFYVKAEREIFLSTLNTLKQLLKNSGNNAQSEFIHQLIESINQDNLSDFIDLVNGVDMWGGAGAVWEVYIENKIEARKFEKEMLNLINLMENTKIMGRGIKPIKKIFETNLTKD